MDNTTLTLHRMYQAQLNDRLPAGAPPVLISEEVGGESRKSRLSCSAITVMFNTDAWRPATFAFAHLEHCTSVV